MVQIKFITSTNYLFILFFNNFTSFSILVRVGKQSFNNRQQVVRIPHNHFEDHYSWRIHNNQTFILSRKKLFTFIKDFKEVVGFHLGKKNLISPQHRRIN